MIRLVPVLIVACLTLACSQTGQHVQEADALRLRAMSLEQELLGISQRHAELRQRVERVFTLARQAGMELDALATADQRIAAIVANPRVYNDEMVNEIEQIRREAAELDVRLRSAHGESASVANQATVVHEGAVRIHNEQQVMRNVANLLGKPLGMSFGSDPNSQPQQPGNGSKDGSDTPLGVLFGLGSAAMGGAGVWAYRRYGHGGRRRDDTGAAIPSGNISVSVGSPAPSYQPMNHPAPNTGYIGMQAAGQAPLPASYSGAGPGGAGAHQSFRAPMKPSREELVAAAQAAEALNPSMSGDAIRSGEHDVPRYKTARFRRGQLGS